jgi:MYXO-CTERM domain-containing protein
MQTSRNVRSLVLGIVVVGGVALLPARATASEVFPGAIQEAANMQCVPLCTLCHTSNPGNAATWQQKMLPLALAGEADAQMKAILKPGDAASLKAAFAAYAKDPTHTANIANIQKGIDPQYGGDICGPTYGCAVHVAKEAAAPRDFTGPLWIVGAVVAGGVLRRRRRKTNAN